MLESNSKELIFPKMYSRSNIVAIKSTVTPNTEIQAHEHTNNILVHNFQCFRDDFGQPKYVTHPLYTIKKNKRYQE